MKTIKILAIAIILSVSASATDFGGITENWLQGQPQRVVDNPTPDPKPLNRNDGPVGDGLLFLTVLAGSYIAFRRYAGKRHISGWCKLVK